MPRSKSGGSRKSSTSMPELPRDFKASVGDGESSEESQPLLASSSSISRLGIDIATHVATHLASNSFIPPLPTNSKSKKMSSNPESSIGNSGGIPLKCVCGRRVKTWTSTTADNPGRPFFGCESMTKKDHLFKWVEEAVLEEVVTLKPKFESMDNEVIKLRSDVDVHIFEIWQANQELKQANQELKQAKKDIRMMKFVLALFGVYLAYKLF